MQELVELGYSNCTEHTAGASLSGGDDDVMRLNLHLRCAHRVLIRLGEGSVATADDLYKLTMSLPWEDYIPADGYFSVISSVDNESITNSQYAHLKLKDAVVDRMRNKYGRRPDSGPRTDRIVIYLHWKNNDCSIYLDTSGTPLSRRGYRAVSQDAPLNELLGAAIIRATEWNRVDAFINPMCGSGTLAIEAALLASDTPSQFLRSHFAFHEYCDFNHDQWEAIRSAAMARRKKTISAQIFASDRQSSAVMATRRNARAAEVATMMEVGMSDYRKAHVPEGPGVVIMNPEYGKRLGTQTNLDDEYKAIGDWFKSSCVDKICCVFTGNLESAKHIGLKTTSRIPFFNADIECRLLRYSMYSGSKRVVKADDGGEQKAEQPDNLQHGSAQ